MNILSEIYFAFCNVSADIKTHLKKWAGLFGLICLTLVVVTIAAIYKQNESIMFYAMFFSSLLVIVTRTFGKNILAKAVRRVGEEIPGKAGKLTVVAGEELGNIFSPLTTVALVISFVGVWSAVCGFNSISHRGFMIALAVATFFSYFGVYSETKTKWTGYALVPIVIIMLIVYHVRTSDGMVGGTIRNQTEKANIAAARHNLRLAANSSVTYAMAKGEMYACKIIANTLTVTDSFPGGKAMKIINPEKEGITIQGEKFLQVQPTNKMGDFVGMDTLLVNPEDVVWGKAAYQKNKSLVVYEDDKIYLTSYSERSFSIDLPIKTLTFVGFEFGEISWNVADTSAKLRSIKYFPVLIGVPLKNGFPAANFTCQPGKVGQIIVS